jgi:predicted enzyme related to lactoylglutathione lyase
LSCALSSLGFDANDKRRLATFWARALGWELDDAQSWISVVPTDDTGFEFAFEDVPEPKTAKNPIHIDLVSESVEHQQDLVDRFVGLGGQPIDIGQGADEPHVVLVDPEGNEFCVVIRGEFLADTGFLGSVVFEPAHPTTGYFWGEALGWPVVYDEGGDVAIRAPNGRGPFITFGPPGIAKQGKNRLHFDLTPDADQSAEVDRLIALGARRIDIGQGDVSWVVMADPDGNEFCVLSANDA